MSNVLYQKQLKSGSWKDIGYIEYIRTDAVKRKILEIGNPDGYIKLHTFDRHAKVSRTRNNIAGKPFVIIEEA